MARNRSGASPRWRWRTLGPEAGVAPPPCAAAIGPCIGACCYEVSEDLAVRFADAFGDERGASRPVGRGRTSTSGSRCGGRWSEAGLAEAHIEDVPGCNACEPERFFSHRRDQGGTGRHLAFIAPGALS